VHVLYTNLEKKLVHLYH